MCLRRLCSSVWWSRWWPWSPSSCRPSGNTETETSSVFISLIKHRHQWVFHERLIVNRISLSVCVSARPEVIYTWPSSITSRSVSRSTLSSSSTWPLVIFWSRTAPCWSSSWSNLSSSSPSGRVSLHHVIIHLIFSDLTFDFPNNTTSQELFETFHGNHPWRRRKDWRSYLYLQFCIKIRSLNQVDFSNDHFWM